MPRLSHRRWHSVRFQAFFSLFFLTLPFKARLYRCKIQEMLHQRNHCLCRGNTSVVAQSRRNGSDAPRTCVSERWHFVEQRFIPHYLPSCVQSISATPLPPILPPLPKIPSANHPPHPCTPLIHLWFRTLWLAFPNMKCSVDIEEDVFNQWVYQASCIGPSNPLVGNPILWLSHYL